MLTAIKPIEGFTRVLTKHVDGLDTSDYTSIARKVAKMDLKIDPSIMEEDVIVIAAESSGIKVANRGEWLRKKWHGGFIQMHIAMDKESKEIVAIRVTKHVHDGKKMISLIKGVEESALLHN